MVWCAWVGAASDIHSWLVNERRRSQGRQLSFARHWRFAGLIQTISIVGVVFPVWAQGHDRNSFSALYLRNCPGVCEYLNRGAQLGSMPRAIWENIVVFDPPVNQRLFPLLVDRDRIRDEQIYLDIPLGLWAKHAVGRAILLAVGISKAVGDSVVENGQIRCRSVVFGRGPSRVRNVGAPWAKGRSDNAHKLIDFNHRVAKKMRFILLCSWRWQDARSC
jgi:hypothetical protein